MYKDLNKEFARKCKSKPDTMNFFGCDAPDLQAQSLWSLFMEDCESSRSECSRKITSNQDFLRSSSDKSTAFTSSISSPPCVAMMSNSFVVEPFESAGKEHQGILATSDSTRYHRRALFQLLTIHPVQGMSSANKNTEKQIMNVIFKRHYSRRHNQIFLKQHPSKDIRVSLR